MRASRFLICLGVSASLFISRPLPAQRTKDDVESKQSAKAEIEKEMHDLPFRGEYDIDEVITFVLRNGRLRPITHLDLASGNIYAIKIIGMSGFAKVQIISDATGLSGPEHNFIQFGYRDLSVPGTTVVYTDVNCGPDSLNVSQGGQFPSGGEWSVQLVQTPQGPHAVTLYVQENAGRARPYEASSIAELSWQYPGPVDQYLRPMFRLLKQEHVAFEAEPRTACQVLSKDWPTDANTVASANQAVTRLAADSYADREAAMEALLMLGEPGAIYLMHADLGHLTTEQAMRVDLFLAPYRPLSEDQVERFKNDPDFLLDCLYSHDATIRGLALRRLRQISAGPIEFDANASSGGLETAVAKLRVALVKAVR